LFAGKVAVVTGASRGIGRALAFALAREGSTVVCIARTQDGPPERGSLNATVQHIERAGGQAFSIACDIGNAVSVKAVVDQTLGQLGRIDLLINNAGVFPNNSTVDTEPEEWDATVAVNVTGPLLLCRYVLPGMIEQRSGNILNFTSQLANMARPGRTAYSVTKAGLDRFTINLAEEVKAHGIAVNALCPGLVATEMTGGDGDPPELVTPAALWLLGQNADQFTGQIVSRKEFGQGWGL